MPPLPLKIVKVMPFFDPATMFGGPVVQAAAVCAGLAERGHQVEVVTTDLGVPTETPRNVWIDRHGYRVHYCATQSWHRVAPYPSPGMDRPLREALTDANILCMNVGLTLINVQARRLAERAGVGFIYNAEGCLCPRRLQDKRGRKKWFLRLFERRILRSAAAVQAVTSKEREDAIAQGARADRVRVIPNGVACQTQDPEAGKQWRKKWSIPSDAPLILFLGRIDAIKGLDLLLQAFDLTVKNSPNARLAIAGPTNELSQELQHRSQQLGIEQAVTFTDALNAKERRGALAAADLFALTSYSEGLPNAALEAAAAGVPLLLTEPCNIPEVETFEAGRVEPLDAARIAESMQTILSSMELRNEMSDNARTMIDERFAISMVLDQLEELYRNVAR